MEQLRVEGIEVKLFRIPTEENYEADMMAKLAASIIVEMPKDVLVEIAKSPYMKKIAVNIFEEKEHWQTPILQYLKKNALPTNLEKAKKVIRKSSRYAMNTKDKLYRWSFSQPFLKCLRP